MPPLKRDDCGGSLRYRGNLRTSPSSLRSKSRLYSAARKGRSRVFGEVPRRHTHGNRRTPREREPVFSWHAIPPGTKKPTTFSASAAQHVHQGGDSAKKKTMISLVSLNVERSKHLD